MPKAKKKLKPTQIFEYKLTLKTYGEPLKYYGFKDIIRRLFRESLKNKEDWQPTKKHTLAKTKDFCAVCLDDININQARGTQNLMSPGTRSSVILIAYWL